MKNFEKFYPERMTQPTKEKIIAGRIEGSRTKEYYREMKNQLAKGKCNFCDQQKFSNELYQRLMRLTELKVIDQLSVTPVIFQNIKNNLLPPKSKDSILHDPINIHKFLELITESKQNNWSIKENISPYEKHGFHLILNPKKHLENNNLSALSDKDWQDWGKMNILAVDTFKIGGGAIVMRFGNNQYPFQNNETSADYNACTMYHLHSHIQVPNVQDVNKYQSKGIMPPDTLNEEIIMHTKHWMIGTTNRHNKLPHQSHEFNLLFNQPYTELAPNPEVWSDLGSNICWLINKYNLPGGGIVIRFGDNRYNNSRVDHLYATVHVPDRTGPVNPFFLTDDEDNPINYFDEIGKKKYLFKATFHKSAAKYAEDKERIKSFE